jgi:hypothetical protein
MPWVALVIWGFLAAGICFVGLAMLIGAAFTRSNPESFQLAAKFLLFPGVQFEDAPTPLRFVLAWLFWFVLGAGVILAFHFGGGTR